MWTLCPWNACTTGGGQYPNNFFALKQFVFWHAKDRKIRWENWLLPVSSMPTGVGMVLREQKTSSMRWIRYATEFSLEKSMGSTISHCSRGGGSAPTGNSRHHHWHRKIQYPQQKMLRRGVFPLCCQTCMSPHCLSHRDHLLRGHEIGYQPWVVATCEWEITQATGHRRRVATC